MHRLFVAIRPPEDIRDLLIDAMDESPSLGWVSDERLHLTLRFIGEVEKPVAKDIATALDGIRFPVLDLAISGVGKFERRNGGALWAAVKPKDQVSALAAKVERAIQEAGIEPELRSFMPHVTLARWNRANAGFVDAFLRRNSALRSEPFRVAEFILFESRLSRHGAHYEEVTVFPLT